MRGPGRDYPRGHPRWLGRQDSDLRDAGVKDPCLTTWLRPNINKKGSTWPKESALYHLVLPFSVGVDREIRTLDLQSHNLAR